MNEWLELNIISNTSFVFILFIRAILDMDMHCYNHVNVPFANHHQT